MSKIKLLTASLIVGITVLAGCGTHTSTAPGQQPATPKNDTSTANTHSTNGGTTNNSTTNTSTTNTTTNNAGTSAGSGSTRSSDHIITESMQLATQGKVIGMSYKAGVSTSDDVQKAWGSPNSQTSAGAGIYLTYTAHHAAFGFNKGDQIFDVRSFSPTLHAATLSEVQKVLGTPGIVRHTANERILLYPAGPDYQLLWVFPMPNASVPNPEVDHVSVFYPRGTIDMMAQDIPNPSVVVDQPPGSVGSLFTFSIKDAPKGYQLAELEWIPATGQAVVDTVNEAIRHGASGGSGPYFQISGDGKTTGFVYTHAMKGQAGVVRLIYQNTNGAAIIGQSSRITLK